MDKFINKKCLYPQFCKKILLKRAKACPLSLPKKILAQIILLLLWKTISGFFKIAKLEFEITVDYGLWAKCTQFSLLKDLRFD